MNAGPGPASAAGRGADPPERRRARLDPETRRTQLVDVAMAQLDASGLDALTVDDVADAAGVSRSLVYTYFGDRNGLAAEVYLRTLERLDRELSLELPADDAALGRMVGACMAFAQRNRAAWRMVVSDPSRQHPRVQQARAARAVRISTRWRASAGDVGAAGEPASAQLAAEASLGMLESGVLHWLDHDEDIPAEQAATLLTTILGSGLTARPPIGPGG